MDYEAIATTLESRLSLRNAPVALKFVKEKPAGLTRTDAVVPSACAFWRRAETEIFYAAAEDHLNCPLGAMVLGFPLPEKQMAQLREEVVMMTGMSYVRGEEVDRIPKVEGPCAGIVYGPLKSFPLEPDVALLWLTPRQAMMMSECCGLINWAAEPADVLGRPGCASIPAALQKARATQSLGCVGMRANTGIPEDRLLMVVPGSRLGELSRELEHTSRIHQDLERHYAEKRARLAS